MAYIYFEGNFECDPIDDEGVARFDIPIFGAGSGNTVLFITLKTSERLYTYPDAPPARYADLTVTPSDLSFKKVHGDIFIEGGPFRETLRVSDEGYACGDFYDKNPYTPPIDTATPPDGTMPPQQQPLKLLDDAYAHPKPVSGKSFRVKGALKGYDDPDLLNQIVKGRVVLFAES